MGQASYRPKTGGSFVFNKDVGGNEFYQYYRYDFADGGITLLTDGKSRNTGWNWSNAGTVRLLNASQRRRYRSLHYQSLRSQDRSHVAAVEWRRLGCSGLVTR